MMKAHKIRLNPMPEQATYFAQAAGTRRFVYNWGLEEWQRQYKASGKPSALALKKQFNAVKGELFPWVYEVTKCAVEGAFMDLAAAFTNFFEGRAKYPKFKAKKRSKEGFYVANDKFEVSEHSIKLPHIGVVNMTESLRFEGKIMSARISQTAG
jgi:putative transposase